MRLPARLLIDLPNWVGDLAMALPLVDRLAHANAGGVTVLHARPAAGRLLGHLFPDTVVITVPPKTSPFAAARRVVRRVGRVDLGLSVRNAWRAKIFLRLVARSAWGSASSGGMLLDRTVSPHAAGHQRHDWDGLLEALGVDPPTDASLRLPRRLHLEARARLADVAPGPTVGLAPAAVGGPSKRWPAERYGRLGDLLSARGWQPVMVVGPGEDDVALATAAGSTRGHPILGADTDVAGLAGLVSELDLVIGNDSGPVQLAATFGTPVVAIFGPTDPRRTCPSGAPVRVVRHDIECAPCGRPTCPLDHHGCMEGLSVDRVLAAVPEP